MNTLLRRLFASLAAALLLAGSASASVGPEALVKETSERMIAKLQQERQALQEHPERIYDLVSEIVLPHFDFERMTRWVLGKHWRRADAGQQGKLVNEFRTLLVRTYASALAEYRDEKILFLPMRGEGESEVTVKTEIEVPGGLPIPVDYSLYRADSGEWKVYDVAVDGLSLVTNYRSSFANEIRASGLDGLITTLAKRNRQAGEEAVGGKNP